MSPRQPNTNSPLDRLPNHRPYGYLHVALAKLQHHYWIIEKSATPTALLLPWFPSPAKRAKEASTKVLYTMLRKEKKHRRRARTRSICYYLDEGTSNDNIIQFVLGVIFAGVANTWINCVSVILTSSQYFGT
jgi:sterol 14-demethylase